MECSRCATPEPYRLSFWATGCALAFVPFVTVFLLIANQADAAPLPVQVLTALTLTLTALLALWGFGMLVGLGVAAWRMFQGHNSNHAASTVRRMSGMPFLVLREMLLRSPDPR